MGIDTSTSRAKPARIIPGYIAHLTRLIPVLVLLQFLSAGLGLFQDASFWEFHGMIGGLLAVPILIVLGASLVDGHIRPLRWWAMLLLLLYMLQLALVIIGKDMETGILMALHPFNAALIMSVALCIVAKVERHRARYRRALHPQGSDV